MAVNLQRSLTMDIGKGVLVMVMLIHHAWSAVYIPGNDDSFRGVVSFVSSAFILFSGYLLGMYLICGYLKKPARRMRRDMGRGFRLLLLFIAFNVLLYLAGYQGTSERFDLIEWLMLCSGPNPPALAVFSLLNAFAWFFFGSSLLFFAVIQLLSSFREREIRLGLMIVTFIAFLVLYFQFGIGGRQGLFSSATIFGCVGIFFGLLFSFLMPRYHKLLRKLGLLTVVLYLVLSMLTFIGSFKPYAWYSVFVLIGSLAVWRLSDMIAAFPSCWAARTFEFLGFYTLPAYLIQVVVGRLIDMNVHIFTAWMPGVWYAFLLVFIVMGGVMFTLILILERLRRGNPVFDRGYRTIFG